MSPELLDPERFGACDDRPTKKSDCYALGMVVYEVCLGAIVPVLGTLGLTPARWFRGTHHSGASRTNGC